MITALLLLASAANNQSSVDVLAQFEAGKVLCTNPDTSAKACSAIAAYNISADGSVIETTELLLRPDQPITLTMSIRAEIDGGSICGTMTLDALRQARVRLNGEPLPPDRNALVLERLEASLAPLAGKKSCEAIRMENNGLTKYGQVEGLDIRLPGKPVMWVSRDEGFTVKPR
jgi:hypothetical protein